jgi:hypothetical protein
MKLESLVSGLSNLSDDELLSLINDIRKDRTERKPTPAVKKAKKTGESKLLSELGNLDESQISQLLKLLGEG